MSVPDGLRSEIKALIWEQADDLHWSSLSPAEKSRWYSIWTESSAIGMRLAPYLDPRRVRVYIKDTLIKDYTRERMANAEPVFRLLGLSGNVGVREEFIKPHGRLLEDGRLIAWSNATEWKLTLMALHERSYSWPSSIPHAAVLFGASERHSNPDSRIVVDDAAEKLRIGRVVWVD